MVSRWYIRKASTTPLTIKGRLLLSILLELVLVAVFSIFLFTSSHQEGALSNSEADATGIVKVITDIRFETFDNLLYHDSLSYSQWQIEHNRLTELLNSYPATNARERALISSMQAQHQAVEPLFSKLVASYNEAPNDQNAATRQYQNLLAYRLVSKQQIEVSSAFTLADMKRGDLLKVRQQKSVLTAVIIALMFLITGINFVVVYRAISKALTVLQEGAMEISKGVLNFRIRYKRKSDEFGVLATSFNDMAANLEQVDRIKSEFVLLVSHQLRTPATAVKGFLSLMDSVHGKELSAKQREIISSAYNENERQIELINEILAVAQVEAGEVVLNKTPTDLPILVQSVVAEQQLFLDQKQQKVEIHMPKDLPHPTIDGDRIRIVLENLVRNASKFSPPKTTIEVLLKDVGTHIEIAVKDHGPGISSDSMDKLFKKFSRVASDATARAEGSGLGLYLSKRIVNLHHGKISVRSAIGRGTTFTVQLPK